MEKRKWGGRRGRIIIENISVVNQRGHFHFHPPPLPSTSSCVPAPTLPGDWLSTASSNLWRNAEMARFTPTNSWRRSSALIAGSVLIYTINVCPPYLLTLKSYQLTGSEQFVAGPGHLLNAFRRVQSHF